MRVLAQGGIPPSLLSFANLWLAELGLGDKRCLLKEDGEALPHPFSGSMKLYRGDGTCLELDTVAKPLPPDHPYVEEVRGGNYDLIVISIAEWCLRGGGTGLVPDAPRRTTPCCSIPSCTNWFTSSFPSTPPTMSGRTTKCASCCSGLSVRLHSEIRQALLQ